MSDETDVRGTDETKINPIFYDFTIRGKLSIIYLYGNTHSCYTRALLYAYA